MTKRIVPIIAAIIAVSLMSFWFLRRDIQSVKSPAQDTIIVGTNADFPPFSFIDHDEIVGFDIDIMKEIAQRLGKKITISNMSFAALIPELQLGTIQAIAAGMTPLPERAQRAFFTTPHFSGDQLMAIQKIGATPLTTADQLKEKSIAVNQGYTADTYITQLDAPMIVRLSSPLVSMGLLAINSGQADVYVVQYSSLKPFLAAQKDNYTISTLEGTAESAALAVSKKFPDLYAKMEKIVIDMINDGTIQQLKKKWNIND